jgi:hypothetical protein
MKAANSSEFSEFIGNEHDPEYIKTMKQIENIMRNEKEQFIDDDAVSSALLSTNMKQVMNTMLKDENEIGLTREHLENQLGYNIEDIVQKCDGIYSEYKKCIDNGFAQTIDTIPSKYPQPDDLPIYDEIRSKILEFLGNEKNGILTNMNSTSTSRFVHLEKFMDNLLSTKSKEIMKQLIQELSFSTMATETTPDGQTLSLSE